MDDTNQPSPLLELPAEMRNEIYDLVLVKDDPIEVHAHDCSTPALLRTCRQIREEATPIFREDNTFIVCVVDLAGNMSRNHWILNQEKLPDKVLSLQGEFNWANLLDWAKGHHDRYPLHGPFVPRIHEDSLETDQWKNVGGVFKIVNDLRGKLAWPMIVTVLEHYRRATARQATEWV